MRPGATRPEGWWAGSPRLSVLPALSLVVFLSAVWGVPQLFGAPAALEVEAAPEPAWADRLREVDPRFWVFAAVAVLAFAGFFQKAVRFLARVLLLILAVGGMYLAYVVWKHSGGSFERGLEFLHDLGAGEDAAQQRETFSRAGAALDALLEEARGEGVGSYRQMLEEAGRLLEERIGSLSGADTEESRAELERMRADVEERLRELLREERP